MSMYDFIGFGKTTSAIAGAGVGAITTHVIHKATTGRKAKKLEERLGGGSEEDIERTIKKIAILKTLAYKDGSCTKEEKLYIHDYILQHPHLPTDEKVQLLLEMNEAPPTSFIAIVKEIASSVKFDDLFLTKEESSGFVHMMYELLKVDKEKDKSELEYIKEICNSCKIPLDLIPTS